MNRCVVDASAVLALVNGEPGMEIVEHALPAAEISSVNLAEVTSKLAEAGVPADEILIVLQALKLNVVDFDQVLACRVGELRRTTRRLSLGDRACLATAQALGVPVLTTDRNWSQIDIGVEIRVVR